MILTAGVVAALEIARMTDVPDTASGTASWRCCRMAARAWGPPGNERLTSSTGLALLATYPAQQSWLSHKHHHREGDAQSASAKTTAGDLRGN